MFSENNKYMNSNMYSSFNGSNNFGKQCYGNWDECGSWNQCQGHGPGADAPCHNSKKICLSPDEFVHIIEEIMDTKEHGKCNREPKHMKKNTCYNNDGCLGYAPKRNYYDYGNNYCGGNYGYNYGNNCSNYGNYGYGYNDCGIWWLLIIVFFLCGGFCFF